MIRTTAQHEKTGEIRNVLVFDGAMHFDLGMASKPVTDKEWIEQSNNSAIKFYSVIGLFAVVMLGLCLLEAYGI